MTKVLMFGWEFPPLNQGGLGTACYGLTKALAKKGTEITLVLPKIQAGKGLEETTKHLKLKGANQQKIKIKLKTINSPLFEYVSSESYDEEIRKLIRKVKSKSDIYGKNLHQEVYLYSLRARELVKEMLEEGEEFDIIHSHDWLTFQAGIEAKKISGKPLVIHVHATEYDRTGGNRVNEYVYGIEKKGMEYADKVIAVSNFTKNKIKDCYGIDEGKIQAVHNAVEFPIKEFKQEEFVLKKYHKIVLFVGRLTLQKGPDYFIETARKVLEQDENIRFIMAGSGDMEAYLIQRVAEMGLGDKILFTGFLRGEALSKAYQMADVYVMPSVSEPFGIVPLEAMSNGTPAIISKQSGVSEVINHCLKVDFWDIDETANKILGLLKYKELHQTLKQHSSWEIKKFNWSDPAEKCLGVYNEVLERVRNNG